jgi:hypothetical protein
VLEAEAAEPGELPLLPRLNGSKAAPLLAAAVFGLDAIEIERLLPVIEQQCRRHGMRPLILTDCDAFQLLRARRLVFEYLPPPGAQHRFAPGLSWDIYLQRRLAVIRRKWQPVRIVAFGGRAMAVLQLWRNSPFEPDEIPALVPPGGSSGTPPAQDESLSFRSN